MRLLYGIHLFLTLSVLSLSSSSSQSNLHSGDLEQRRTSLWIRPTGEPATLLSPVTFRAQEEAASRLRLSSSLHLSNFDVVQMPKKTEKSIMPRRRGQTSSRRAGGPRGSWYSSDAASLSSRRYANRTPSNSSRTYSLPSGTMRMPGARSRRRGGVRLTGTLAFGIEQRLQYTAYATASNRTTCWACLFPRARRVPTLDRKAETRHRVTILASRPHGQPPCQQRGGRHNRGSAAAGAGARSSPTRGPRCTWDTTSRISPRMRGGYSFDDEKVARANPESIRALKALAYLYAFEGPHSHCRLKGGRLEEHDGGGKKDGQKNAGMSREECSLRFPVRTTVVLSTRVVRPPQLLVR
ncbi:hypothetical protein EDB83DRAFT_2372148 [Lactarius deliciosus]|nr:hypothetical protein EDB83DRAFT_2372148 [Lactarius deliciosus]